MKVDSPSTAWGHLGHPSLVRALLRGMQQLQPPPTRHLVLYGPGI